VAGSGVTNITIARYALGIAGLIVVCGSLGLAAVAVRRRWLGELTGAVARLAEIVIGLALLIALLELLGTVGLFSFAPIVIGALIVGLAGIRAGEGAAVPRARVGRAQDGGRVHQPVATAIALMGAAAVIAEWAAPGLQSYDTGIRTFDSLWYHLPWAASFAQTGRITSLRFTDVEYLTPFYPATSELIHGLGIVLLGRDTLSPGLNLVWLSLALLAGWCIGRARGVGPGSLLGTALAMGTPMVYFSQAGSAANDVVGIFFLLAAVALVLAAGDGPAGIVLAAIAAGLAAAVKLSMLAPALALTVGVIWISPSGRRVATAVTWLVPAFLAGGFWYVRNLIAVGNPLPWVNLPGLATPAPPLQQHTGYSIAHYLTDGHFYGAFVKPGLASGLGPWWPVVVGAAVIGPLLCLLPAPTPEVAGARGDRTVRMLGLVALASLAAYIITPESAAGPAGDPTGFAFNLRYSAPALTLALAIFPLAPVLRGARASAATLGALAIVIAITLAEARLWPAAYLPGAILIGALALGAVALLAMRSGARRGRGRRVSAAFALGVAAALVLAGAAAGYVGQRHYLRGRFVFGPGVSHLSPVWALFRGIHDARVGIVGTYGGFFSYPLDGLDDSNRVQYVGQRGAHGSFTPITNCRSWREAVNAGGFDYLVTTPARDPWRPSALEFSPEGAWTATDPAAHLLYSSHALGQRISVFKLTGPLDPDSCPA
jgi:hypothetical protein